MIPSTREYCDIEDVENYMLITIDEDFKPQVRQWIRAVSRQFDRLANRKLVVDIIGSGEDYPEQYYDGSGGRKLLVDDFHDLQSVEIDDVVVVADNYKVYPASGPHNQLRGSWPRGDQNIKVVANFGYFEEVPDDIRLACAQVVAGIINNSHSEQTVKSESIGNYSVTYGSEKGFTDFNDALAVVESYRRIDF